jgi:protein arginine kinase activator
MKCQACGVREATTHIQSNINGAVSERHLCASCAAADDMVSLKLPDVFQSLFGVFPHHLSAAGARKRCPKCALSFDEIAKMGKVGCAECYRTFFDELASTIQRIHGRVLHGESTPAPVREESCDEKITKRKAALQEAIQAQDFETAAKLRDEIRALEGGDGQ